MVKNISRCIKFGYDSIRLVKWLAYYDRSYNEKNYFDLLGSF